MPVSVDLLSPVGPRKVFQSLPSVRLPRSTNSGPSARTTVPSIRIGKKPQQKNREKISLQLMIVIGIDRLNFKSNTKQIRFVFDDLRVAQHPIFT